MGHARALVSAGNEERQIALYETTVHEGWSVRQLEQAIKSGDDIKRPNPSASTVVNKELTLEQDQFRHVLAERISAKVDIKKSDSGRGKLVINFDSETDLNRIIELLNS
jgi:ParB family transcriptional regulator, chromosome partitioning protein